MSGFELLFVLVVLCVLFAGACRKNEGCKITRQEKFRMNSLGLNGYGSIRYGRPGSRRRRR